MKRGVQGYAGVRGGEYTGREGGGTGLRRGEWQGGGWCRATKG